MEIYKIPQGKMVIAYSSEKLSIGLLELDPKQELAKHDRPCIENLIQISGTCMMKLFEGENLVKEVPLKENESLEIPANVFHIHSNPADEKSVTLWRFDSDITKVISSIRSSNPKL
jgi:mannose-6-phosphate isomerase-like protein (cupin superfamily)